MNGAILDFKQAPWIDSYEGEFIFFELFSCSKKVLVLLFS